jgi:hypothetical protein
MVSSPRPLSRVFSKNFSGELPGGRPQVQKVERGQQRAKTQSELPKPRSTDQFVQDFHRSQRLQTLAFPTVYPQWR